MNYRVTYAVDSLDPNPTVMEFEEQWEALEWIHDEVSRRVQYEVEHSQYAIGDDEYDELWGTEMSLVRIEEI